MKITRLLLSVYNFVRKTKRKNPSSSRISFFLLLHRSRPLVVNNEYDLSSLYNIVHTGAPAWVRLAVWPARPQSKEIWLKGECATLPVVCKPKVSMMLNSSPRLLYWPKQRQMSRVHIQFYLVLLLRSYLFLTIEVKPPPSNCLLSITFGLAWLKLMVTSLITCMYHLLTE